MEYSSVLKNKETLTFAITWVNLQSIMLGEINQTEKGKYFIHGTTYLWCGFFKKTSNAQKQRVEKWSTGAGKQRKEGEFGKRVQLSVIK